LVAIRISGGITRNSERAREFESATELSKIGKPVNRDEWQMLPPAVNIRVKGVLVNMPAFARAFECREEQPMAPAKRCRVW